MPIGSIHTMNTIKHSSVSYLTRAESRSSQGCHNDHGDNNLDGGRGVSHLGYFVVVDIVAVAVLCENVNRCHNFCFRVSVYPF
jgi:hypothetical protein